MKNTLRHLQYAISILYLPLILIFTFFTETNDGDGSHYPLIFLVCFLYSFPLFSAFIEACATICRILEKDKASNVGSAVGLIRSALAVAILATLIKYRDLLYLALILSLILSAMWVLSRIIAKKERKSETPVRKKPIIIACAAIIAFVLLAAIILSAVTDRKNRGELTPTAEASDIYGLLNEI